MLTTQNIPNKFRFSTGRILSGISQRMKKTFLTILTALVKGDVKSRNNIYKKSFFFTAIPKDFHSEGALAMYLLLPNKKTNTKTITKNTWSVIYRIGSYIVGSKIYIIWLSFCGTRTWCLTNDFTERANKSALHDSLSWKTKLFYRFDGFFGDRRTCSGMIEGKRKISWSVHKLQSENLPIKDREMT